MGLLDKVKGILFDEEEVELPEIKKETKKEIVKEVEEDSIKEIKVPKDDFSDREYKSESTFTFPIDLEDEAIGDIAEFRVNEFLEDMSGDFMDQTTGSTRFLTEALLDEFIDKYVSLGLKELQSVRSGSTLLRSIDFAWKR